MYLCQILSYHDYTTGNHDELELDHGQAPETVSSRDFQPRMYTSGYLAGIAT
jgi:hypothetical protein